MDLPKVKCEEQQKWRHHGDSIQSNDTCEATRNTRTSNGDSVTIIKNYSDVKKKSLRGRPCPQQDWHAPKRSESSRSFARRKKVTRGRICG
jgi:hypothetical protein